MPVVMGAHGPLGVQRGSLVACMAWPCDAIGAHKTTSVTAHSALVTSVSARPEAVRWLVIGQEAAPSCLLRVLNAAHVASFRRCMHGAKPTGRHGRVEHRRPCRSRNLDVPSSSLRRPSGSPCLAGLALSLRRRHRQQRLACIARRWGWCSACTDEATGRTAHEWCSACVVRLDPCLSSDVLTRMPSQSWSERRPGSLEVSFLCCIPKCVGIVT